MRVVLAPVGSTFGIAQFTRFLISTSYALPSVHSMIVITVPSVTFPCKSMVGRYRAISSLLLIFSNGTAVVHSASDHFFHSFFFPATFRVRENFTRFTN